MRNPPVSPDLVEWLKATFPPRCIGPEEHPIEAHRYAAQVQLARRLIRMGTDDRAPEGEFTVDI